MFNSTLGPIARRIRESVTGSILTFNGINDGEFLKRSSNTIISGSPVSIVANGSDEPLLITPASPSAYDDEFDGSSLDSKWTKNPLVTANTLTNTVSYGRLRIQPSNYASSGKKFYGIAQVETGGGSFKIWAKLSCGVTGTDAYCGLMVGVSGGSGKGHVFGTGPNIGAFLANMGATTYNEGASDWSGFDGFNNTQVNAALTGLALWYRIRWDAAATTLYFDYATDGDQWKNWNTRTGMTQPNRIGLGMYAQAGPASWASPLALNVRCFRYEANATF